MKSEYRNALDEIGKARGFDTIFALPIDPRHKVRILLDLLDWAIRQESDMVMDEIIKDTLKAIRDISGVGFWVLAGLARSENQTRQNMGES